MGIKRQGKRALKRKAISEVKYHKREIKRIVDELEYINGVMFMQGITLTEDNIEEEVAKISEIKLGATEKMILLNAQEELKSELLNNKEDE